MLAPPIWICPYVNMNVIPSPCVSGGYKGRHTFHLCFLQAVSHLYIVERLAQCYRSTSLSNRLTLITSNRYPYTATMSSNQTISARR
jgi:hypothetical protein